MMKTTGNEGKLEDDRSHCASLNCVGMAVKTRADVAVGKSSALLWRSRCPSCRSQRIPHLSAQFVLKVEEATCR